MPERGRLILGRKLDERIVIETESGELILVQLMETRPGRCRLCIDAPRDVTITREELLSPAEARALPPKARAS